MDERLETAVTHWAPRLISTGVLLSDFEEVTAGINRWQDWCSAWVARAGVHEAVARASFDAGCNLTGGELMARAAVYYHFAKFVFVEDLEQMRAAHVRAVECRRVALPHLRPPGTRVEIPFEGSKLAANLRKPMGVSRPPVVIMVPGLDSTKEELEAYELPFLARGMATLIVDGPGQGEAEYDFAIRGNYETAACAIIDWIEVAGGLDAGRVGMWGVSMGGYYAPRSAAYEKRIKACIGLSGPFNFGECWKTLPQLTRDVFRVRGKCGSEAEAQDHAHTLSLEKAIREISCPLMIVAGKQDRIIPWEQTARIAEKARAPVELIMVDDGNHVVNNKPYLYRSQTADWMACQLGLARL